MGILDVGRAAARKYDVGVLSDAVKKGDKEALDHFDTSFFHWTSADYDKVDMRKGDIGFHLDPTPDARQANQRRRDMTSLGRDEGRIMPIRANTSRGETLVAEDVGDWNNPMSVYNALLDSLDEQYPDLADEFIDKFEKTIVSGGIDPLRSGTLDPDPVKQGYSADEMQEMRDWLLSKDIRRIDYSNKTEGTDVFDELMDSDPDWMTYEADMREKILDAEKSGDETLSLELENELEYERDNYLREMEESNLSTIALDPADLRDAERAAFKRENIGKAGLTLAAGGLGVGLAGGSQNAEAGALSSVRDLVRMGFPEETAQRIASGELPMDRASRMERAREQGYDVDTPYYHGTDEDFTEFKSSKRGKMGQGVYSTPSRQSADKYAPDRGGANIIPLYLRGDHVDLMKFYEDNPDRPKNLLSDSDYAQWMNARGIANIDGMKGDEVLETVTPDPSNIRSVNAAFDPKYKGANILGGSAAAALIPSATIGALAGMSPMDAGAATLDVASRIAETVPNELLQGSQMLSNELYGTDYAAPQVDFAPSTGAGEALSGALMEDLGTFMRDTPLGQDVMGALEAGTNFYNDYIEPNLSESWKNVLGGSMMAGGALAMPLRRTVVNTADTRLGNQTAAAGRKMMENQPAQIREALAEAGDYETVVSDTYDLRDLPVLSADDLRGAALMPTLGDRTAYGKLEKVQGQTLDKPLQLQSGPQYGMASLDNTDNPAAWESTEDIAKSYQNKVQQVAEDAGTDNVLGIYSPMKTESANFSTMPAEVALRQFQQLVGEGAQYDPAMVRAIDEAVRSSGGDSNPWKDFPGIMSDEAEEWLTRPLKGLPAARKAMLNTMKGAPFRDAGFPLIDQIYRDISVPELAGRDVGESGDIIMRLDPRGATDNYSNHRSYGTRIPGEVIGRLDGTLPHGGLYIDPYRDLEGAMTTSKYDKKKETWSTPRPLNSLEKTNTVAWNKPKTKDARTKGYQMGTDELVDYLLQQSLLRP